MTIEESYLGTIQDSTIKLNQTIGIPDGAEVQITIKPSRMKDEQRNQKLEAAFGSCREDAVALDEFLYWNKRQRSRDQTDQSQ